MYRWNPSTNLHYIAERYEKRWRRIRQLTGRDRPLTEAEIRARMRPQGRGLWLGATIMLALLSYLNHSPLLALTAALVASLGVIPAIWNRLVWRDVTFRRAFSAARVQLGEPVRVIYEFENRKFMPVPWLELEDEFAAQLVFTAAPVIENYKPLRMTLISTFSLWRYQRVTRRYAITPTARGVWNFGPAYLRAGDPFGFLDNEIPAPQNGGAASLTVFPLVAPLTAFGLPPRHPFGDINARRRFIDDPAQVVGARDYIPGDPLRQIHWKATARSATLQSKVYPPTTTHALTIFIDSNTTQDPTFGVEPVLLELGIAAAASVAAWATERKLSVGVFTNGLPAASDTSIGSLAEAQAFMRVAPSHHPDQLGRILEALARIQPLFGSAMDTLLAREQQRMPFGATVVYISAAAAMSELTLQRLQRWQRRGHTVTLLLTGDTEVDAGALRVYRLGGEETWNELFQSAIRRIGIGESVGESGGSGTSIAPDSGRDTAPPRAEHQPAFTLG